MSSTCRRNGIHKQGIRDKQIAQYLREKERGCWLRSTKQRDLHQTTSSCVTYRASSRCADQEIVGEGRPSKASRDQKSPSQEDQMHITRNEKWKELLKLKAKVPAGHSCCWHFIMLQSMLSNLCTLSCTPMIVKPRIPCHSLA